MKNIWLASIKDADVVCSWDDFVLENTDKLENVSMTYPFIELGYFNSDKLAEENVYIA